MAIYANIFKVDYAQISRAIQSFTATDEWGSDPSFIVMSLDTLKRLKLDNIHLNIGSLKTLDYSHEIMGVPIAINNTLELGEIRVV
jgi:hypothetical protein